MEVKLAVSIWTLLLLTVESESHPTMRPPSAVASSSPNTTESNRTTSPRLCPTTGPTTAPPQPGLVVFTVHWDKGSPCAGKVRLSHLSSNGTVDDYYDHNMTMADQKQAAETLLSGVCEGRKDCRDDPSLDVEETSDGRENLAFRCKVSPVESKVECEAVGGYKAMTGLLLTLVAVILVVRFGKPTLKTFQKRMSDRRNSRWIGPTQSQSVSYHRGKTAVQNNDTDNRLSYPALERLTVNNSREPSSNRNSDFDF